MSRLSAVMRSLSRDELVLRMSAVMLMVHGAQSEVLAALLTVIGGLGVVFPRLLRSSLFWWSSLGLMLLFHGMKWFWVYNHKILFTDWVLACALAVSRPHTIEILEKSARWLVGLCFVAACGWKLYGAQFFDGSYVHYLMLCNVHFTWLTGALSGLPPSSLTCEATLRLLEVGALSQEVVPLPTNDWVANVALFGSFYTIAIEGLVGVLFLLGERLAPWWRHGALWLFIVTVYPIANVPAFALVLLNLSLADVREDEFRLRVGTLVMMAFSVFSFMPKRALGYLSQVAEFIAW